MIPILKFNDAEDAQKVEALLSGLRLEISQLLSGGKYSEQATTVRQIIADVAARGDAALTDNARKFDFAEFSFDMLRVTQKEMRDASARVPAEQLSAIRRSIAQVREYQDHIFQIRRLR